MVLVDSLHLTSEWVSLKSGEEYKTTFQTHFDQYEFNVMTFVQAVMNGTLAPGLPSSCWYFFMTS
jgi:hypothetical protein